MPAPKLPINIFENLYPVREDFRRDRILFGEKKDLIFSFYCLEFQWIVQACDTSRSKGICRSESEYAMFEESSSKRIYCETSFEVITAGVYAFLVVDTRPAAHVDFKGKIGIAELLDIPVMDEDDLAVWDQLGASTNRVECSCSGGDLWLSYVKEEEGKVNSLILKRKINLRNGQTELVVECPRSTLPSDPTIANLTDWIGVRDGKTHPVALTENLSV